MGRIFKGVSIVIHAIVIATISYVQVFVPGNLPSPHSGLTFGIDAMAATSVPIPPPARQGTSNAASSQATLAPIAPPDGVRDEPAGVTSTGDPNGVPGGIGDAPLGDIGVAIVVPPPPPAPEPPPTAPFHVGGNVRRPEKIFNVDPIYPPLAQAARKEGIVILEVIIDPAGRVESVRVLRGVPTLDHAAVDAVQQWRFTPATLNGRVIPVVMTVTVNFQLTK